MGPSLRPIKMTEFNNNTSDLFSRANKEKFENFMTNELGLMCCGKDVGDEETEKSSMRCTAFVLTRVQLSAHGGNWTTHTKFKKLGTLQTITDFCCNETSNYFHAKRGKKWTGWRLKNGEAKLEFQ